MSHRSSGDYPATRNHYGRMFNSTQGDAIMLKTIRRLPAVQHRSGLSRSTIYLRISQGLWTKPVSLGGRAIGWPDDEIDTLNAARIAGKTDDEIRQLVQSLHEARKSAL